MRSEVGGACPVGSVPSPWVSHMLSVADGAHSPRRMPVPRSSSAHGSVPLLMGSTVWLRSKPEALRDHERGGETQTEEGVPRSHEQCLLPKSTAGPLLLISGLWT